MGEKIKVYVDKDVYGILVKDAEFFEFYKSDHTLNRNDFINTLIVNYFDSYYRNDAALYDKVNELLHTEVSGSALSNTVDHIVTLAREYHLPSSDSHSDMTVSVKPTRRSSGIIDFIQDHCLADSSLSSYFRSMFASYCSLPQDKREEIIFRDKFELISQAVNEGRMIYFTTRRSRERHLAAPYGIARSQEELFNYLLCRYNGMSYSFRMTRIQNIVILSQPAEFSEAEIAVFEKMKRHAPQFTFDDNEEICVRLSQRGVSMFDKIYSYRPKPVRIIKDLYYFDCSAAQIYYYFFRFGRNAVIMYPHSLRQQFAQDYQSAADVYQPQK